MKEFIAWVLLGYIKIVKRIWKGLKLVKGWVSPNREAPRPPDARKAVRGGSKDSGGGFGDPRQPEKKFYAQVTVTSHLSGFKASKNKAWALEKEYRWRRIDLMGNSGAGMALQRCPKIKQKGWPFLPPHQPVIGFWLLLGKEHDLKQDSVSSPGL